MHKLVLSPDISMLVDTFFEDAGNEEFRLQLNRSSREKGAETYSARVLNHWEKEGVIGNLRDGGRGWRKYSLLDRIWIQLVQQLRAFGYPLVNIKQLKEALDNQTLLEFAVGYSKLQKQPLRFLVTAGTNTQFALLSEQGWPNDIEPPIAYLELDVDGLVAVVYLQSLTFRNEKPELKPTDKIEEDEQEETKYRSKMFQYFNKKD